MCAPTRRTNIIKARHKMRNDPHFFVSFCKPLLRTPKRPFKQQFFSELTFLLPSPAETKLRADFVSFVCNLL